MAPHEFDGSARNEAHRPRGAISRASFAILSMIVVVFVVLLPAFGFVYDVFTGHPSLWGTILGVPIWGLSSYYIVGGMIRRGWMWRLRR